MDTALTGIPRNSIDGSGGLKYILVALFNDVKTVVTDGLATFTLADDTAITSSNSPFVKYKSKKEMSSMVESWAGAGSTGSGFNEEVTTMVFSRREVTKRNELMAMARQELVVIGVDWNGEITVSGSEDGTDLTANVGTTGVAMGDANGYTVTLMAHETILMPHVASVDDLIPTTV